MSARTALPFRFGRRLALLSMAVGLLLALILSALSMGLQYRAELARRYSQIDEIARASLPALQEAMWLGDAALVASYLDGLMQYSEMARVELAWAEDIKPPIDRGQPVAADLAVITRTVPISRGFKGREMVLGTLTLTLSLAHTYEQLRRDFWQTLLSQTLQMGALAALILLLYQRLGGRRLQAMADATVHYRNGDTAMRMRPSHATTQGNWDELDQLATEFNGLLDAQERHMAALRASNESLGQEVAERQRAEGALRQARDVAETANLAKSAFLANMSHELRTPLNAILGFAQLMSRDNRLPAEHHRNLETINRSGQHLLALINDVLEISRIEANRLTAQHQPFELQGLIQPLTESMMLRAREKGLALRVELAPDLPSWVVTDPLKLRQILLNLLSNAVKYTERGGITLSVTRIEPPAADQDTISLRIAVRDTGVGIAAEDQARLFQPFFQTDYGTRLGQGTGLGLTLCHEYVRLLGGRLSVESIPGQGSTFAVELPVHPAAPEVAPAGPTAVRRVARLAAGQPASRVLVAEDDDDSRLLLVALLEQTGFQVRAVTNGAQATAAFSEWQPDFVWMDMRMPIMDGYEAARIIRGMPGGDRVKIVALTASAFQEDRAAIIAAGCTDALPKPLEEDRLFAMMGRLLGLRFDYQEPPLPAPAARAASDLKALPPALAHKLAQAARELDADLVTQLVDSLRDQAPAEAVLLSEWLAAYRLDTIAAAAEAVAQPEEAA